MLSRSTINLIALLFCVLFLFSATYGASDVQLLAALDSIIEPPLAPESALAVTGVTFDLKGLRVTLNSGMFVPFQPIQLDAGVKLWYGGLFHGSGRINFEPPLAMEQHQVHRFFDSDTLDREFSDMLILFNEEMRKQLVESPGSKLTSAPPLNMGSARNQFGVLNTFKDRSFYYDLLRSASGPLKEPFAVFAPDLSDGRDVVFECNPYYSEEMTLYKRGWLPSGHYLETICSYSLEADETTGQYNGRYKGGLNAQTYDIDAKVFGDGVFDGIVKVTFKVDSIPAQIVSMGLSSEMKVDSVVDSAGGHISFKRYKDGDDYVGFWLVFPRFLQPGEMIPLTFYYSGDVAIKNLGEYYVFAGSSWYPRCGRDRASYKMRFRSKADYSFCATGHLVESRKTRDTLFTTWEVKEPAANVSLNIGLFKEYHFGTDEETPIDIYFSEDLHRDLGTALAAEDIGVGRHMEKQVAQDIRGSLKVFSAVFGPYSYERLAVSEVLHTLSTAYPGSVQLGYVTWISTDQYGYDRLHRSHETAHQWWGATVGYETYHDRWLSEGFAEYSAFMYLQAAQGNDQFMDRLNEYRKDILTERKDEGAIGLGYRASTTKDPEHFELLVYKKGAFVLHMLRNLLLDLQTMKEDRFVNMLKDYYTTYKGKDPSTADFQHVAEKHIGIDMTWFFREWIYGNGIPTYDFKYTLEPEADSGQCRAQLHIEQSNVPADFKMYVPLEIQYDGNRKQYVRLLIDQPVIDLPLVLPAKPKKLVLNPLQSVLADVKQ